MEDLNKNDVGIVPNNLEDDTEIFLVINAETKIATDMQVHIIHDTAMAFVWKIAVAYHSESYDLCTGSQLWQDRTDCIKEVSFVLSKLSRKQLCLNI